MNTKDCHDQSPYQDECTASSINHSENIITMLPSFDSIIRKLSSLESVEKDKTLLQAKQSTEDYDMIRKESEMPSPCEDDSYLK